MKYSAVIAIGLLALTGNAFAAGKSCDELKSEIQAKIEANHVSGYSLDVVDKGSAGDRKVVGTCGGGAKEIVYARHASGDGAAQKADEKAQQ